MTVDEAVEFFPERSLRVPQDQSFTGSRFGYITLGQSLLLHLSGGEAQRLKLATELGKKDLPVKRFIFLDEPTTGFTF